MLNDDPAVVSIFAVSDIVNEGTTALFTVQVSNEIATSLTVTIDLTPGIGGEFGISPGNTNVVINAGETTALLTVMTIDDDIGEAYGSLIATVDSLRPEMPVSGVQPTTSDVSATVTILDDDLDLFVSITTLDENTSTTVSESDEVISLRLMLSDDINRPLRVNLSRDTEISGIDLPSFVVVPDSMTTHNFSVFVIDDTIVAQPERNIAISVDTGVGYTASTVPVTVKVIDDDTATVTISPVNSTIVQSEPAVFKVMLGLETAVDVDIGIDVEFGEGFITNQDRRTTVTVTAGQMSTLLTVPTVDNTEVEETSSLVATLRAIPHTALTIGDPSSATVVINALGPLSIAATPASLSLVEGDASTQISVSLSRIDAGRGTVTVTIELEGSGLRVSPSSLTFSATKLQTTVTVIATEDTGYTGNRDATLTLTADGYPPAMVTVTILENDLPLLGLSVEPPAVEVVTGASTPLSISVSTTATITITGGGSTASVPAAVVPFTVGKDQSTTINVFGDMSGTTTLTITAAADGYVTARATVEVEVLERLSLAAEPGDVDLVQGASTQISVRVSRIEGSEVTVEIAASTGLRVEPTSVTLTDRAVPGVTTVTADVDYSGTATVTFEAVGYESTLVSVTITRAPTPELGQINLGVAPPALEIVTGESTPLSISVSTTATITITGGGSTASVPAAVVPFTVGKDQSTTINVFGDRSGTTTLTITAVAAGYETTRTTVEVEVLERLSLAAEPVRVDLVAGASTQISVRVSRIEGSEVTVEIAASTGLRVEPTSVTLTDRAVPGVTTVTAGADYSGTATVTFEAVGYESTLVSVTITRAPTPELGQINLGVAPPALEIVTGESTPLSISVSTTATITITGGGSTASVPAAVVPFTVGKDQSTTINVFGVRSGTTTLTIEAVAAGYVTARATVEIEVLERLSLAAEPVRVDLVAGASTEIRVRVSRIEGSEVTVEIAASTGLRVEPTSVTLTDRAVPGVTTVTAGADYSGTATVTFEAVGYESTLVSVTITRAPTPELGQINLSVIPPALEIVTGESTPLSISVSTTATITITGGGSTASVPAAVVPFTVGKDQSTTINVFGDMSGTTTLTIEVVAAGYVTARATVEIEVLERLSLAAEPVRVDLVAGASTEIRVRVSRIEGSEVTVEIAASTGLRVEPTSVTLTDRSVPGVTTVTAGADYSGTATVTFEAVGYESTLVSVTITRAPTPELGQINLGVAPPALEIVTGESTPLSISVSATATITITGGGSTASVPAAVVPFTVGKDQSTTINVFGVRSGTTTLTIEAVAAGYETTRATVEVEVLERLSLAAEPVRVDLVAGASTEIRVRVSRIEGSEVTVEIAASTGLRVEPTSVTLTDRAVPGVTTVTAGADYSGTATVTFEAVGYESTLVSVTITRAPTPELGPINLSVIPPAVEIVTGESTPLSISVSTTATITITGGGSTASVPAAVVPFTVSKDQSTTINVFGVRSGTTTLTIEAVAAGYETTRTTVEVEVLERLSLAAEPVRVDLVQGASTQISVRVSRIEGSEVTVEIDASASLMVASSVRLTNTDEVVVAVTATDTADIGIATLTFTAAGYTTATVTVDIRRVTEPPQPQPLPIELEVEPPALEIVTGESTNLTITAGATTATIMISAEGEAANISVVGSDMLNAANAAVVVAVEGGVSGVTTVTITAEADSYTSATASVRVDVIESLRIAATPPSVDLVAGASTEISVSVSRLIGESVTVDIAATTGLSVASSVTLANLDKVVVAVTATESYSGTATVTFTATDYTTATVTVEIMDAPPPSLPAIGLVVVPPVLEIVTGESTNLTITAGATTATITIMSDSTGIASVAESAARFELAGGAGNSTRINVFGGNVDTTTLTITATAAGYTSATTSVRVDVIESLRIAATPPSVDLVAGASTQISVSVSRLVGESVTVDIVATTGLSVPTSVTLANLDKVAVAVTTTESYSGTATVTFTATDYTTATVTVEIMDAPPPSLPAIGLVVVPPVLEIVTGESTNLTITAGATTATITIMSDSTGIASVAESAARFELAGGAGNSTRINVFGGNVDTTTLTITAEAAGYTSATTSVRVDVIESLRIAATPPSVDLVAGASTQISVSVSRLVGESVTVDIVATTGLSVPTSVTLANLDKVAVAVTATESYSGTATVTFTATNYTTATVTVEIMDAPPPSLPAIGLVVVPPALEIVTGESTNLTITAGATTATITIAGGDDRASVEAGAARFTLIGGADNSTQIDVFGVRSGTTTLTIEAVAAGYETTRATVEVNVIESLRIVAEPGDVVLVAGASTQISVSVSRLVGESVTVDIVATTGLSVPTSVTLANLDKVAVAVTATESYSGTATVTFTATDYTTATVTVRIAPPPSLPAIGLVVVPPALEIVIGTSTNLTITAGATTATITINAEGEAANISVVGSDMLNAANAAVVVAVEGGVSGVTTVTITAEADSYTSATASVRVDVIESLRIAAEPDRVNLVQGASTQVRVRVSRIEGSEVTVEIDASASLMVASSVRLTNTDEVVVAVTATDTADIGIATLTFTAAGYTTATVTVDIRRVTEPPQPQPLPIELEVEPPALEIVTGESTNLTITAAATTATIMISAEGEAANISVVGSDMLNAANAAVVVAVEGGVSGVTTVTITAEAAGYTSATASVRVDVIESLRIVAEPGDVDLVAGASTQISVRVSRIEGSEVTVEIAASTGLRVEPTSVRLTDRAVPGVTTVTAGADYSGTATVTFEAVGYESTLVSVTITRAPTPELGQINLGVAPPALEIVTGESTPLSISVSTTATITITGGGSTASVPAAVVPFTVGKDQSTQIDVFGDRRRHHDADDYSGSGGLYQRDDQRECGGGTGAIKHSSDAGSCEFSRNGRW